MFQLGIRPKLLLAMMVIVAGVTTTALLVTQHRIRVNYERMFRDQYERQISYFTSLQEARLDAVKESCSKLAKSPRLTAVLRSGESERSRQLYELAEAEFRPGALRSGPGSAGGGNRGGRLPGASLFCFLDASGNMIPDPRVTNTAALFQLKRRVEQRLEGLRRSLEAEEAQNIAYVPMPSPAADGGGLRPGALRARSRRLDKATTSETHALQEVIITRIVHPDTQKTFGALVLLFPLPDLLPAQPKTAPKGHTNQMTLLEAGILLDERLFANPDSIPEARGEVVAAEVLQHVQASKEIRDEFTATLSGISYRVFYEQLNPNSKFAPAYQVCLFSLAGVQRELEDLRWKVVSAGMGAILVALLLSLAVAHGFSAPIRRLVAGTGEIQRGNYEVRVPVTSADELGMLTQSFNEMAVGLAEKERYRTVLNTVADERIARRLVAGELSLGGELREISVLFCDIRGFTALTQQMPPGEVIEMLNEHMTALSRVVMEHGGLLDKFVGDLMMAIFGAPISSGDDAWNAVQCAARLIAVRAELNRNSRHQIEVGIGVATGTVVAGCMGSQDRLHYTVLGERVNLASRLCDRAAAGEVWLDDTTRARLEGKLEVQGIGEIPLKGFAGPVPAFRLIRASG